MRLSYDLHLHSCLSPCGAEEMTPGDMAAMCALAGLDVVALTDHNTAGNCAAFAQAARERGLLALSGMELCTREEIHVVCLFETPEEAMALSERVRSALPSIPNNPALFGPQILMDKEDGVLGEETALLAGAADIGIDEVRGLAAGLGGVAFPAHIDRPSFSLLSVLGLWDPGLGFPLAELSRYCPPDFLPRHPELEGVRLITNSDAHDLDQIPDPAHFMDLPAPTARAVLDWLACGAE